MRTDAGLWSIGLARGMSLADLQSNIAPEPLFSNRELLPFRGRAAADPFAIRRRDGWYVFFECFINGSDNAAIACVHSPDLQSWEHSGIVLQPVHHLSYPFVFEHGGEIYMMPESKSIMRVDLYRAVDFPRRWEFVKTILRGRLMDASMVHYGGRYWIIAGYRSYWLRLFYAANPLGPWHAHWMPSARHYSKSSNRPGGRPVVLDGKLIRLGQDNVRRYGHQLRAFTITMLNRLWYRDQPTQERPILQPTGTGWTANQMHHADIHLQPDGQLLAFVDGSG